jgi:hypothetical protein
MIAPRIPSGRVKADNRRRVYAGAPQGRTGRIGVRRHAEAPLQATSGGSFRARGRSAVPGRESRNRSTRGFD